MNIRRKWYSVRWSELAAILALLIVAALVLFPTINPGWEAQRRATCQANLRLLGMALHLYANESIGERFPPMHGYETFGDARNAPGCLNVHDDFDLAPEVHALYPEYLKDPLTLVCLSGPYGKRTALLWNRIPLGSVGYTDDAVDATGLVRDDGSGTCKYTGLVTNGDVSYTYLGWAIDEDHLWFENAPVISPDEAKRAGLPMSGPVQYVALACRILEARDRRGAVSAALLDADILLEDVLGDNIASNSSTDRWTDHRIPRLSNGVERYYIVTSWVEGVRLQREMAVAFDNVLSACARSGHVPAGGNVLYMDGHVDFVKYPERVPMTANFAGLLAALNAD